MVPPGSADRFDSSLAKIRYIAQELELCFAIVRALPSDHLRRVLARRLAIRTRDFIEHARHLRKPLKAAGFTTQDFHSRKEAYARAFFEYFPALRDRMGAHLQDMTFIDRLKVWSSVEVVKLGYFVEGAREIYSGSLGALGIPGYLPYEQLAECTDSHFSQLLDAIAGTRAEDGRMHLATDLVAGTRPQDAVVLNESPPHMRAKQLLSLGEWGELAWQLQTAFSDFPNAVRIVKTMAITDVVSMADCLVTRSLAPGAPQEMKGLEQLLREADEEPIDISSFLKSFCFADVLETIRPARDKIGGHLDLPPTAKLSSLFELLDRVSMLDVYRFHDKMRAVFLATCRRVAWLRIYLVHNEPLHGATCMDDHVKPFDDREERRDAVPVLSSDYSEGNIRCNLDRWIEHSDQEARDYFWRAFLHSGPVGCDPSGTGSLNLRVAHQIVLQRLLQGPKTVQLAIIKLMGTCRNGSPRELIEVLLRLRTALHKCGDRTLDSEIHLALGEMPSRVDEAVATVLRDGCSAEDTTAAADAATALYLFLVRPLSHSALNKPPQRHVVSLEVFPRIQRLSTAGQLIVLLRCASAFTDQTRNLDEDLADEYSELKAIIRALL